MAVTTTNLGVITAYGDAVAAGYTGTKAEWQALMASYATVGQQAVDAKNDAVAAKNTAVSKATEATTAASTATTKANEASASAQSIAQSASQIAQNTSDISELKEDFTALAPKEDMLKAFPTDTATGSVASFADGANVPVKSLIVNIDPVQSGSGDPSPTNIRPISGWSEVNVQRTGKNLLALPVVRFSEVDATIANCFFIKAGTYCVSFDVSGTHRIGIRLLDLNGNVYSDEEHKPVSGLIYNSNTKSYYQGADSSKTHREVAVTIVQDCYVRIVSNLTGGGLTNAQLELGSTATPYEPYSGQSITIPLGQTVYGGTLDVLSGELVIDRAGVDMGTLNWRTSSTHMLAQDLSPVAESINTSMLPNATCSIYKATKWGSVSSTDNSFCVISNQVLVYDSRFTDATAFKAAVTGQTLVYELATPITVTLTPHEVRSLLGSNNVWADCGDTEVTYRADPTLYISRLTEPDADMIADANITSGQYFMVGNTLYKATANIASGATISPNVNCTRKSLSEALNEINA